MITLADARKLEDERIVELIVQERRQDLFEILYDRFADRVYAKCKSLLKNEHSAEDAAHEIFLKIFVKLGTFKFNSKFGTWVFAITNNACLNILKKNQRTQRHFTEYKNIEINDVEEVAIDEKFYALKVDILFDLLTQIPKKESNILIMKYQDGISITELSTLLDISESAVKMRIKRAKDNIVMLHEMEFKKKSVNLYDDE